MPITVTQLVSEILPERTVLLFGAGASVPSKAPSVGAIQQHFANVFQVDYKKYNLREQSSLIEARTKDRKKLISELRSLFRKIRPTGGLLNLPHYDWKSIFTTNYDNLVEECYKIQGKDLSVYSSNFDFTEKSLSSAVKLFKLHGTIEKDISDGNNSRIILTDADYDHTEDYREQLYDRLKSDLAASHLIVIGQSLADEDLRDVIKRASAINAQSRSGRLSIILYERDEDRALLYENRGFDVCFSGIDEFFAEFARRRPAAILPDIEQTNLLQLVPLLMPITVDVEHAVDCGTPDVSAMFNGWAAQYADIHANLTFQRTLNTEIEEYLQSEDVLIATIVGASGVGKTTTARQIMLRCLQQGLHCWEHQSEHSLPIEHWFKISQILRDRQKIGILFIDEAHSHLQNINELIDKLSSTGNFHLRFLLTSSRNHWYPRIKTPNIYRYGLEKTLSTLRSEEIERLLHLVDANETIRPLVEPIFNGFSRYERRRRLVDRCEKDFFVCLKNIFATENLDDIILREYAQLSDPYQDIYKHISALEYAGVKIHRQLIIRILNIRADTVSSCLGNLAGIVQEYDVNPKEGIYGWRTRHAVIAGIISKYKFGDLDKLIRLFERVIDGLRPTFDIEIRTIRDLCNLETGIPRIPDREVQNVLLRKMMSVAPGERIPRHRLIRNLIESGSFEKAETEIRIFTNDFGADGPVHRYRVNLLVARAIRAEGILEEDRISILEHAQELAVAGTQKYPNNKNILSAYVELGIEYWRRTGKFDYFDDAIQKMKLSEEKNGDPEISKAIVRYERQVSAQINAQNST